MLPPPRIRAQSRSVSCRLSRLVLCENSRPLDSGTPGDGHDSEQSAHRRARPRRRTSDSRRRHRLLRAGRELPRGPGRPVRRPRHDCDHHLPARRRRREHGGSLRQADRTPGRGHGHARAGRLSRGDRAAQCRAGLDADGAVHRPGRARALRPRGVPGDRLPALPRAAVQVGGADRGSGAHSRAREPGVSPRVLGAAGTGGGGAARGHAGRGDLRSRMPGRTRRCRRGSRARRFPRCGRCSPAPAARWSSPAAGAGRRGRAPISPGSWRRTRSPPPHRFAARTGSTTRARATRATSGSASTPRWPIASATPTCCWSSERGSAR